MELLDEAGRLTLADALGDTPQTAMSTHRLRRHLARAAVAGPVERPTAAIVQAHALLAEPAGFGDNPATIWNLLRAFDGWTSVHVAVPVGPPLAALIAAETGRAYRLEAEMYFQERPAHPASGPESGSGSGESDLGTLTNPARMAVPDVRRLTEADVPLMEEANAALTMTGWRFGSAAAQIADGYAAGAIVDGTLVAVAFTASRSPRYGEVGIHTLAPYRGRGYAAAAAALVAADLHRVGLTVIWSTSTENLPSRRIAAKLGLVEVSRRVYLYPVD